MKPHRSRTTLLITGAALAGAMIFGLVPSCHTSSDHHAEIIVDALVVLQAIEHAQETGQPIDDSILELALGLLEQAGGEVVEQRTYQLARIVVLADLAGYEGLPEELVRVARLVWPGTGDEPAQAEAQTAELQSEG